MSAIAGALSFLVLAPSFALEPEQVDLRYRSYRNWKIELPAEKWMPVKDGIGIAHAGGEKFSVRIDGNNLEFDTDGDGKLDRSVKALVDPKTLVSTTRVILEGKDTAGNSFKYAIRLRNDANGWEWAPGGAMAGTIKTDAGPVPVKLIDQNGNGSFADIGEDAMIVGSSDNAVLLSSTIYVGDELAKVEYLDRGASIKLTPFAGATASLDMTTEFQSKAVLISSIIVSEDGQHSFDIGAVQGAVTVPAGKYRLAAGQIGLGGQRVFINTGRTEPIVLEAGESRTLSWGGPLKSEFKFNRSGNEVVFSPDAIWYFGNAGEQYVGWTPKGKSPEFTITDAKTGAVLEVAILPGSC